MYWALIHSKNKHKYKKIKEIILDDKIIGLIKI